MASASYAAFKADLLRDLEAVVADTLSDEEELDMCAMSPDVSLWRRGSRSGAAATSTNSFVSLSFTRFPTLHRLFLLRACYGRLISSIPAAPKLPHLSYSCGYTLFTLSAATHRDDHLLLSVYVETGTRFKVLILATIFSSICRFLVCFQ